MATAKTFAVQCAGRFLSAKNIAGVDAAVLFHGIQDLLSRDDKVRRKAVRYFYFACRLDEQDPKSFSSLCKRHNLIPDYVARMIWGEVLSVEQRGVILQDIGMIKAGTTD